MNRFLIQCLAVSLLLGLSLPLEGASEKPKRGGTLTVAVRKDMRLMNALVATSSTDHRIRRLMFESLLAMDLKGNIHPNLAEAWKISKDGKLYTFKLREGVKFHNGQEMTAEDVKFAMDYTMNPKNGAYGFVWLSIVDRVEAAGKYTLKVYLRKASASLLSVFTTIRTFSVIPKGSLPEGVRKIPTFPPGTGAFKFVEWKTKQRIVFKRVDNYWGHKAFIDKLVLQPVRNDNVRITALRTGEVDIIARVPYEWVQKVLSGEVKGIRAAKAPYGGIREIEFNVAAPPFNNKKLRQAVAYALDRKEFLDAAWYGYGEPTDQRFPKGAAWYLEKARMPSYDLNKARALLAEAGYKGQTIKLLVNNQRQNLAEAAVLQAQLKKIGMNIELDVADSGATTSLKRQGKFAFNSTGGGSLDRDPSIAYARELRCGLNLKKRTDNRSGYCDKEMDVLIKKLGTEVDPDRRRALAIRIVNKVGEDIPKMYIGFVSRFWGLRDYVKGFASGSTYMMWYGGGLNYVWLDK